MSATTTILPAEYGLPLKQARLLLTNEYLPLESGVSLTEDGMHHIAASTYMKSCTGKMIDWWFGWIHTTEQYKLWHPRDHVSSDWIGPRGNESIYIGDHHLVEEYIGGEVAKLKISFQDPALYFGDDWKTASHENGHSTAVCGRCGTWDPESNDFVYTDHLIHLIKDEPDGVRMRSRFWLGDVDGVVDPEVRRGLVPEGFAMGLLKHCTEEMAILGTILPDMYKKHTS